MEATVAADPEHVPATAGAWLAVILIVAAFTFGTFALIVHSIPLWIATGVAAVAGIIAGIASGIMEQAY
jgi:hypothetical protein